MMILIEIEDDYEAREFINKVKHDGSVAFKSTPWGVFNSWFRVSSANEVKDFGQIAGIVSREGGDRSQNRQTKPGPY